MSYKTHPDVISERPWLEKILPHAHKRGRIYCYGVKTLKTACQTFYKKGKNTIEPFSPEYEPNPWEYQYDLELHIWLNYQKITDRETSKIHDHIRKREELEEDATDLWERLDWIRENGVTGLPREEHWWNASEIRWPTTVIIGEHKGQMVRDPWAQERIKALCQGYKYVCTMGGGGQGKTHTFCGFLLTMFEHFMFTQRGAKCSFSTTSETKLRGAAWPAVTRLLASSEAGISLTAGKSIVSGDYTLKRHGNKQDTAGVMKGILLGDSLNESKLIDKLTGSHGHDFYGYLIDEGQNTPLAPIKASRNFLLTGTPAFVVITGNYDRDDDSLGLNTKPKAGWDSVSPSTFQWIGRSVIGQDCLVQHYNNSLSPAYLDESIAKKYPYLPNRTKEKITYPSSLDRVLSNNEYRRFWVGWRSTDFNVDSVLNDRIVKSNNSHQPIHFDERFSVNRWFSLDTAQGQDDRNRILVCADGIDINTREWIWGVEKSIVLPKIEDIRQFEIRLIAEISKICRENKMTHGIMDWSNLTGIWARLLKVGIDVMPLIYHNKIPDGKEVDKHSKIREQPILLNPNTMTYGHHECSNKISLGAYALNKYCTTGKLRGINESLLEDGNHRPLSEEIYMRQFERVLRANSATGELKQLDSKEEFKAKHKFSPDIFDCLAQAAYYALAYRRIPLYVDVVPDEILSKDDNEHFVSLNDLEADHLMEYL